MRPHRRRQEIQNCDLGEKIMAHAAEGREPLSGRQGRKRERQKHTERAGHKALHKKNSPQNH